MKKIFNKRTICDVVYDGEHVTLNGTAEANEGNVTAVSGNIILADGVTHIGNYSLLGINLNDAQYVQYRTEVSKLIDEMVSDINTQTIMEA